MDCILSIRFSISFSLISDLASVIKALTPQRSINLSRDSMYDFGGMRGLPKRFFANRPDSQLSSGCK